MDGLTIVLNHIQSHFLHEKFTFQFGFGFVCVSVSVCVAGGGDKYLLLFKSKVLNSPREDIYQYTWHPLPWVGAPFGKSWIRHSSGICLLCECQIDICIKLT